MSYLLAAVLGLLLIIGILAMVTWDDVRDRGQTEIRPPDDDDR